MASFESDKMHVNGWLNTQVLPYSSLRGMPIGGSTDRSKPATYPCVSQHNPVVIRAAEQQSNRAAAKCQTLVNDPTRSGSHDLSKKLYPYGLRPARRVRGI